MNRYISEALRRLVSMRAEHLCEYCLIDSADTFLGGEVDHIVSVKHGGATEADNLAYTCQPCNRNKGSDLGSIYWPSGQLVRFFHPRTDRWTDDCQQCHTRITHVALTSDARHAVPYNRLVGVSDSNR
jgi:5-methylcytosine-specific restriction endonuclease McrA